MTTSWVRSRASSFIRMRPTWVFAVAGEMMSRSAISRFGWRVALLAWLRGELGDQLAGDARREQGVAAGDDAYGVAELVGLDALEQEAARSCTERLEYVFVEVE